MVGGKAESIVVHGSRVEHPRPSRNSPEEAARPERSVGSGSGDLCPILWVDPMEAQRKKVQLWWNSSCAVVWKWLTGSWVLSDSPILAGPTGTWEGHGRGDTCSLQVAEQVGLPLEPGGRATQLRVLARSRRRQSFPRKLISGLILTLPENSQPPSGCWEKVA